MIKSQDTNMMDPIFDILMNSRNPTTWASHASGVVETELKRRGICISCGANSTVKMTLMGVVKRKSNHECYEHDLCVSCYEDSTQRNLFTCSKSGPIVSPGGILGIGMLESSPQPSSPSSSLWGRRRRRRPVVTMSQRTRLLPYPYLEDSLPARKCSQER